MEEKGSLKRKHEIEDEGEAEDVGGATALEYFLNQTYERKIDWKVGMIHLHLTNLEQMMIQRSKIYATSVELGKCHFDGVLEGINKFKECPPSKNSAFICGFFRGKDKTGKLTLGIDVGNNKVLDASVMKPYYSEKVMEAAKVLEKMKLTCENTKDGFKKFWQRVHMYFNHAQDLMIVIYMEWRPTSKEVECFTEEVRDYFTTGEGRKCCVTSLYIRVNQTTRPMLQIGPPYIEESIAGLKIHFSPKVQMWTDVYGAEILCKTVAELLAPTKKMTVLDLRCSLGLIGLFLAKFAGQVLSVDMNAELAKSNAELNNVTNYHAFRGEFGKVFYEVVKKIGQEEVCAVISHNRDAFIERTIAELRRIEKLTRVVLVTEVTKKRFVTNFCNAVVMNGLGKPFLPVRVIPVDTLHYTKGFMMLILLERMDLQDVYTRDFPSNYFKPSLGEQRSSLLVKDKHSNQELLQKDYGTRSDMKQKFVESEGSRRIGGGPDDCNQKDRLTMQQRGLMEEQRRHMLEERRKLIEEEEQKRRVFEEEQKKVLLREEQRRRVLEAEIERRLMNEEERKCLMEEQRRRRLEEIKRRCLLEEEQRRLSFEEEWRRHIMKEEQRQRVMKEQMLYMNEQDYRNCTRAEDQRRNTFEEELRRFKIIEEQRERMVEERMQHVLEEEHRRCIMEKEQRAQIFQEEQKRFIMQEEERRLLFEEEQRKCIMKEEQRRLTVEEKWMREAQGIVKKGTGEQNKRQMQEDKPVKHATVEQSEHIPEKEEVRRKLEEQRLKKLEEEKLEQEKKRKEEEEKRKKQEQERKKEEEERKKKEEERKKREEEERKKREEEERKKREEEEGKKREEEEGKKRREEEERKKREEEERKKKEEDMRRKREEEERRQKREEEERRRKKEEEERRRKKEEEERKRKKEEEEKRRKKEEEERKRKKEEEERRRKKEEEERKRKKEEEERRRKKEEEERKRKKEEEERKRKKDEEQRKRWKEEEERQRDERIKRGTQQGIQIWDNAPDRRTQSGGFGKPIWDGGYGYRRQMVEGRETTRTRSLFENRSDIAQNLRTDSFRQVALSQTSEKLKQMLAEALEKRVLTKERHSVFQGFDLDGTALEHLNAQSGSSTQQPVVDLFERYRAKPGMGKDTQQQGPQQNKPMAGSSTSRPPEFSQYSYGRGVYHRPDQMMMSRDLFARRDYMLNTSRNDQHMSPMQGDRRELATLPSGMARDDIFVRRDALDIASGGGRTSNIHPWRGKNNTRR